MRSLTMLCLAVVFGLALGCGEKEPRISGSPEPDHASEVARDPYAVTCRDLARQTLHRESAKLVIRAEFAPAQDPILKKVGVKQTPNRTGRSVYFALTQTARDELGRSSRRAGRPSSVGRQVPGGEGTPRVGTEGSHLQRLSGESRGCDCTLPGRSSQRSTFRGRWLRIGARTTRNGYYSTLFAEFHYDFPIDVSPQGRFRKTVVDRYRDQGNRYEGRQTVTGTITAERASGTIRAIGITTKPNGRVGRCTSRLQTWSAVN